ncbi:hypothetical protein EYF80_001325 [Liparis tanakae]|uniref:Uncharacterized protein n=1 Tax=Liparis tanakae TaxID=230148 RepID=A0A4Z2JH22_9TELE|nr:hypothetical protein EYF80_001325 [Liparis tanakae]
MSMARISVNQPVLRPESTAIYFNDENELCSHSLCAVSCADTLHVENIHHNNLLDMSQHLSPGRADTVRQPAAAAQEVALIMDRFSPRNFQPQCATT